MVCSTSSALVNDSKAHRPYANDGMDSSDKGIDMIRYSFVVILLAGWLAAQRRAEHTITGAALYGIPNARRWRRFEEHIRSQYGTKTTPTKVTHVSLYS